MKIELKNIKYSDFASQETYCYEASLYVDGKKVGTVSNDGHGGCDYFYGDRKVERQVNEWLAENGNPLQMTDSEMLPEDLEMRCHDLVAKWLTEREVKKILRRISYLDKGEDGKLHLYQLPAKYKPTAQNLEQVKQQKWWGGNRVMISGLPVHEAEFKLREAGIF